MSAQIRIIPPNEADAGFGLLKDIVALAKNPNAIKAAYAETRKQATLTEEQQKKYAEALAFMNTYEAKKKEIENAKDDLKNHQEEHSRNVEKNNADHIRKHNELQEWEARNRAKEIELEGNTTALAQDRQAFSAQISQHTEQHAAAMLEVAKREETAQNEQTANAAFKKELDEYKAKLDARARKLVEVASGD